MVMNRYWLLPIVLAGAMLVAPVGLEAQQQGSSRSKASAKQTKGDA